MIRVFRSLFYSLIGMSILGWLSISLIIYMLAGPEADDWLTGFVADTIIMSEKLEDLGINFSALAEEFFRLAIHMNITLLVATLIAGLSWSAASHYLNIDAPGKAKIYAIHWLIFTGIFVAVLFGIVAFFTQSTTYSAADFLSTTGIFLMILLSIGYYFIVYYMGVVLGTARFARSSVLFANKLPGNL